ncbi:MAG: hypothetical protein ACC609_04730 [Methanobacterium formicicum]
MHTEYTIRQADGSTLNKTVPLALITTASPFTGTAAPPNVAVSLHKPETLAVLVAILHHLM